MPGSVPTPGHIEVAVILMWRLGDSTLKEIATKHNLAVTTVSKIITKHLKK